MTDESLKAHGIIVPLLKTAKDAHHLIQAAKFPPTGQRGFGSPFTMEKFGGITQTEYLMQANDHLLTIVQIETKEALENVSLLGGPETLRSIDTDFFGATNSDRCNS